MLPLDLALLARRMRVLLPHTAPRAPSIIGARWKAREVDPEARRAALRQKLRLRQAIIRIGKAR